MKAGRLPRLWGWKIATIGAALAVVVIAPQQAGVVAYKLSLITLALVLGYWADRSLFARAPVRLDQSLPRDAVAAARLLARAVVVLAVVLGITLGI